MSKRAESRYHSGERTRDWVKRACRKRDTFTIAGIAYDKKGFDGIYLGRQVDGKLLDEAIRKAGEPTAANAFAKFVPCRRITGDAIGGCQHLDEKGVAQARCLNLIPTNSVVQFHFGNIEKANLHARYLAAISLKSLADKSPRR